MRKEGLLVYEEYPVEIWDGDVYLDWSPFVIASGSFGCAQGKFCEAISNLRIGGCFVGDPSTPRSLP
jgi:hypothetical protein